MRILYRQDGKKTTGALSSLGIKNCFFKSLDYESDYKKTTSKSHFHTDYEIHLIASGSQAYEYCRNTRTLKACDFIVIPPGARHRVLHMSDGLKKFSLTFGADNFFGDEVYCGVLTPDIIESAEFIRSEYNKRLALSSAIIENRIFELLIMLSRLSGFSREESTGLDSVLPNDRLFLAKKFISDNIKEGITVSDVAAYCHLSTRQLTRIFLKSEGVTPSKHITNEKMLQISSLLKDSDTAISELSRIFSYNNEYYFNTAFKKHFGVPPSTYRKMYR